MTDQEIIEKLKDGERIQESRIITQLYKRYEGMVCSIVFKYGYGKSEDVKAILNHTLSELTRKIRSEGFHLNNTRLSTLFYSIAKNQWLNELRGRDKYLKNKDDNCSIDEINDLTDTTFEEQLKKEEIELAMQSGLLNLDSICFHIIYRYWILGISLKDIGNELGMSESAVKKRHQRCKKKLRILIEGEFKKRGI